MSVVRFVVKCFDFLQAAPSSNQPLGGWTEVTARALSLSLSLSLSLYLSISLTLSLSLSLSLCLSGRVSAV